MLRRRFLFFVELLILPINPIGVNRSQILTVSSLEAWTNNCRRDYSPSTKRFHVGVFGSFLSLPSLQLVSLLASEVPTLKRIYGASAEVEIVFLPISRAPEENKSLLENVEEITFHLSRAGKNPLIARHLRDVITDAIEIVQKNRSEFKAYCSKKGLSFVERSNYDEMENRFLYGAIAQKYLSRFQDFPVVSLNGTHYEGIPVHMSVSDFFRRIVLRELNRRSAIEKIPLKEQVES